MANGAPRINIGAYWGEIQAGAASGRNVVQMQQAIHVAYFQEHSVQGVIPRDEFQRLFGLAIGNRRASEEFGAAPFSAALGPEHLGRIPSAPPAPPLNIPRRYIAQFEHRINRAGVEMTVWRTTEFGNGLPATKSEVMRQLTNDANLITGDYPEEVHLGFGMIRLLAA